MHPKIKRYLHHALITVELTLIWTLVSLLSLGLLLGPATVALYHILFHLIHNNKRPDNLIVRFKKSLTISLPQSVIFTLFSLGLMLLLYYIIFQIEQTFVIILIYFLFLEILLMLLFAFPIMALFKQKRLKTLFKTSFFIANIHGLTSILMVLLLVLMGLLAWGFHPLIIIVYLPLYFYLSAALYRRVLVQYIANEKKT